MKEPTVCIDYVTVTFTEESVPEIWYALGTVKGELETIGKRKWRFFGYEGDCYFLKEGHFAIGTSSDARMGTIVQASGAAARKYWRVLIPKPARVSRIDLAADAKAAPPDPDVARECWEHLGREGASESRYYSLVESRHGISRGGDTLYVGSRSSDQFGRVYDKSAKRKEGDIGSLWRYEVELKRKLAKQVAVQLLDAAETSLPLMIANYVYEWFRVRGVPPIWDYSKGATLSTVAVITGKSDEERLLWLRKQVSPTVANFVRAGRADQVLKALGLEDYFDQWLGDKLKQLGFQELLDSLIEQASEHHQA